MTTKALTSRRLTRYLAAPALALGVAIGSAGVANAVWDIEVFDQCHANTPDDGPTIYWDVHCCDLSGGVWRGPVIGCVAPPAETAGRNPLPSIPPTHVMQPSPLPGPPGDIGPETEGVG
jgi:hypothetical protein